MNKNMTGSKKNTILVVLVLLGALFIFFHGDIPAYQLTDGQSYNHAEQQTSREQYAAGNTLDKPAGKNRTIWNSLPPGTQMGTLQVAEIRKALPSDGNLLVWGLGNDSPYWHDSTQGKVIFIEPEGFWFRKVKSKYPYLEACTVNYTTDNTKSFDKYINNTEIWSELDIRSQLPPVLTQTPWNVIIVDAPPGYKGQPGRYQSIYTSYLLARNGTHIFVDDYERKVERRFSQKVLGTPIQVVSRPWKSYANANQQAHFIQISQ